MLHLHPRDRCQKDMSCSYKTSPPTVPNGLPELEELGYAKTLLLTERMRKSNGVWLKEGRDREKLKVY